MPAETEPTKSIGGSSMAKKLGFMAPRGTMKSLITSITINRPSSGGVGGGSVNQFLLDGEEKSGSLTEDESISEASAIAAAAAAQIITRVSSGSNSDCDKEDDVAALPKPVEKRMMRGGTVESRRRQGSVRNLRLEATKGRPSLRRVRTEHPDQEHASYNNNNGKPDLKRASTDNGHGPKPTLRRVEKPAAASNGDEQPKHPAKPAHSSTRSGRSAATSSQKKEKETSEKRRSQSASRRRRKVKVPTSNKNEATATNSSSSDVSVEKSEGSHATGKRRHQVKVERRYSTGSTDGDEDSAPKVTRKGSDPRHKRSKSSSRMSSSKARGTSTRNLNKASASHGKGGGTSLNKGSASLCNSSAHMRREAASHHLRNSLMTDSSDCRVVGSSTRRNSFALDQSGMSKMTILRDLEESAPSRMSKRMSLRELGISAPSGSGSGSGSGMSKRMSLRHLGVSFLKAAEQNQSASALDTGIAASIMDDSARSHGRRASTTMLPENIFGAIASGGMSDSRLNNNHNHRVIMSDGSNRRSSRTSSRNNNSMTPVDEGNSSLKGAAVKGHHHHHQRPSNNKTRRMSDFTVSTNMKIDETIQEEESLFSKSVDDDDESTVLPLEMPTIPNGPLTDFVMAVTAFKDANSCSISTLSCITKDSALTESTQDASRLAQNTIQKFRPMMKSPELGQHSVVRDDSRLSMNRKSTCASCSTLQGINHHENRLDMSLQNIGEVDDASVEEVPMTFDTKPKVPQRNATSSSTIDQMNLILHQLQQQQQVDPPKAPQRAPTNTSTLDKMTNCLRESNHKDGPGGNAGGEKQFNGAMTALESMLRKDQMALAGDEAEDVDFLKKANVKVSRRRLVRRHSLESASGCSFVPAPENNSDDDKSKLSRDDLDLHRRLSLQRLNFASQRLSTLSKSRRTLSTGRGAANAAAAFADDTKPRMPKRCNTPGSVAKPSKQSVLAAKRNAASAPKQIQRPRQTLSDDHKD